MDIKNRIEGEVYFVTDTVVDWVDILVSTKKQIDFVDIILNK